MSSVILLAINAKYVHSSLSVWALAGGVSRYARLPHEVTVIEDTINRSAAAIAERVTASKPDVVGISAYIWNAGLLAELLPLLREQLPGAVFVLGGPEASFNAKEWLIRGADFVLRGEAELSFPALLDKLVGYDVSWDTVSGLCRMENGKLLVSPEQTPPDELLDPYNEAYFDALGGRIAYAETTRGCPFQCAFCLSGGSNVRFFPLEEAKTRLTRLANSGSRTVKLVDRTFNCNPVRAYALFSHVIRLDTSCCFHFEVAADLFDERTLSLLRTAPPGRIQLEAGLQSFYTPALEAASRVSDLEKAERNLHTLLSGGNIHVHVDLIAGLPYETAALFQDSFDRAYALGAHTLQLGFLKLLHGSRLRAQAKHYGIVYNDVPPYEILSNPWLSAEDIQMLKQTENALQHTYNNGRFLSALRYVLQATSFKPFALYRALGEAVPNHGQALDIYAGQLYESLREFPGVDAEILREHMICDWLGMVRGKNMPPVLKRPDKRRRQAAEKAEKALGRRIDRDEAAVLPSGRGVFADSKDRDPVTGLYRLHFVTLE